MFNVRGVSPAIAKRVGVLVVCGAIAVSAALALAQNSGARVIHIVATRYEYLPDKIVLKRGEPVVLELVARDRLHGFHVKGLDVRADVVPGHPVRVSVTPEKVGVFPFTCDLFCGSGHAEMNGTITVTD